MPVLARSTCEAIGRVGSLRGPTTLWEREDFAVADTVNWLLDQIAERASPLQPKTFPSASWSRRVERRQPGQTTNSEGSSRPRPVLRHALESILGLGQLEVALQHLDTGVKRLGESRRLAAFARTAVRDLLVACTDNRAALSGAGPV